MAFFMLKNPNQDEMALGPLAAWIVAIDPHDVPHFNTQIS